MCEASRYNLGTLPNIAVALLAPPGGAYLFQTCLRGGVIREGGAYLI